MDHISGIAREQMTLFPEAVEDYIGEDNPIRFVDAYVNSLSMQELGFAHATVLGTGRPPYDPKVLLKLYLYGYLNRIRSSRLLERETKRNLELFWLLQRLSPDHKTISNFRKENASALRATFKQFVLFCKQLDLFSADLVAIDSKKFTASNARGRVKDAKQLNASLKHVEDSIVQYLTKLDQNDSTDDSTEASTGLTQGALKDKIAFLRRQKEHLETARTELIANEDKHISLTDPDCRLMKNERRIEPAYSVQTAVDAKHSLIVEYELTQDAADNNHLASLAAEVKDILDRASLTVCADAGYYDSVDLKACEDNQIQTYVPVPRPKISKTTQVPTPAYYHDKFVYDSASDTYQCPEGKTLDYFSATTKEDGRHIGLYRTSSCVNCPQRALCTTSPRGRYINRWEHEAVLERLKQRLLSDPSIIKRRKAIIEHIFGTIKKIWGYGALLLRRLANVGGEVGLTLLTYNIKRTLSIVGVQKLLRAL